MKKKLQWFTLVELIVVITILTILATVAFISISWYTRYARDVVRVTDLNNMKSVLEYMNTESWYYPYPDESTDIVFWTAVVWKQWVFWPNVSRATKRLNKVPSDPLNGVLYTYSVWENRMDYELAWAYEWDDFAYSPSLLSETYAAVDIEKLKTRIIWNYNWKVKVVKDWWVDYVLALPTMIAIDTTDWNLENIITSKKLTYNGFNSLPHSYGNITPPDEGAFEFIPKRLVVWSWSIDDVQETWSGFTDITTWLYTAYIGTNLYLKWDEYKFIDWKDVVNFILKAPLQEWKIYKNCKEIQGSKNNAENWCYSITGKFLWSDKSCLDTESPERYYCDMTTDWWGWTMYAKIKGTYEFTDAVQCVIWNKINNSELYCRVPFTFGKAKEILYEDLSTGESYINNADIPFKELGSIRWSFYKSAYFDIMYYWWAGHDLAADLDLSNVRYARLWINFQHTHPETWAGRNPGGSYVYTAAGDWYMNYDSNGLSWPNLWQKRETTPRIWEFYVR